MLHAFGQGLTSSGIMSKALAKQSSQLKPTSQLRWSWVSFGHPLGSSWLEFDQNQIFAQLKPSVPLFGHLKPTLAKLFSYCYVTVRSFQTIEHFLARWLAVVVPFVHQPMQVLILKLGSSWLELGAPFGQGLKWCSGVPPTLPFRVLSSLSLVSITLFKFSTA